MQDTAASAGGRARARPVRRVAGGFAVGGCVSGAAPSTTGLRPAVPLPRRAGEEKGTDMSGSAVPASVVAELVAAARGYLRLADSVEGALLGRLAAAAVETAEAFCGVVFVQRPFTATLPGAAGWQRLPARPVVAIGAVARDGESLVVDSYAIDIDADANGWVGAAAGPVTVSYTAGLATSFADVPAAVAQGMVALTAHLFEARDGTALPPAAVAALWRPYRALRLMEPVR